MSKNSKPLRLTNAAMPIVQPNTHQCKGLARRECKEGSNGASIFGFISPRIIRIGLSTHHSTCYYFASSRRPCKICSAGIHWYSGILWTVWIRGTSSFSLALHSLPGWQVFNYILPSPAFFTRKGVFHMCDVSLMPRYLRSRRSKAIHCSILLCKQMERITRTSLNLYRDRLQ